MPLQATSGAASYDAFGGGVAAVPNYIEEVFSTYLYTGNGSTQTITNGIDLAGKGGLVWIKIRGTSVQDHALYDTARTARYKLSSNLTSAQVDTGTGTNKDFASFNSNGFSLGASYYSDDVNGNSYPYASWTFRKQPKFFDVVTYTGNSTSNRAISHSLGSEPGCIITFELTGTGGSHRTWHRSLGTTGYLSLDLTAASASSSAVFNGVSSTTFTIGNSASINETGINYVAYLFAHNAGGFGLTGTDNVISCGSYTGNGSAGNAQTLGYEPQWMIVKKSSSATNSDWFIVDTMRGFSMSNDKPLYANQSAAEDSGAEIDPTATGFQFPAGSNLNGSAETYIYIAIRRGPMAVPTSGTSVFVPYAYTGNGSASRDYSAIGIPVDMNWTSCRSNNVSVSPLASTRLQGNTTRLQISSTGAEATGTYGLTWNAYQNGVQGNSVFGGGDGWNTNSYTYIGWNFRRAPGFFDEVCYTGTGSARTINHNLGVAPEMIICKTRSSSGSWAVWHSGLTSIGYAIFFSSSAQSSQPGCWNSTLPTSSVFSVGNAGETNQSADTFVSYLFATCAGVSKVGSYTGTGTTLQVDCGFTAGSRFVLIKRTDSTGDWYVWDSARGIVAGNDPYLLLNSTAAEVTSTDYVDTYSAGFEISSTAPSAINASGGTFIFLAIA